MTNNYSLCPSRWKNMNTFFLDKTITMRFTETCMGLQKGSLEYWVIMEQKLFKYVHIARITKGSTSQIFLQLLEMHLDNVIF